MKIYSLILFIITFSTYSFSQSELSFGLTQAPFYSSLGKFMNEDFLLNDGIEKRHDTRNYYKYGINLSYKFCGNNNNFHLAQFIIGHRHINEKYRYNFIDIGYEQNQMESTKYNQLTYVVNYLYGKTLSIGKFNFDFGLGISLQRIGKGNQNYYIEFLETSDSYNYYEVWDYDIITAGGWGVGLLGSLSGSYDISNRIGFGFRLQSYFSYLFFNDNDRITGTYNSNKPAGFPNSSWDNEVENDFHRFDASRISPELFMLFKL